MTVGRDRLLEILLATSFRSEKEPVFRLASGRMSQYYIDCRQALSFPEARALLGALIFDRIAWGSFDAVGGMELGAYPIAIAVSDAIYQKAGRTVRAFVVRKQPKTHGVGDLIAGQVRSGDRCLIVDDVITSGKSTADAIAGARGAGLIVDRAIVILDRQEAGGRSMIENLGVRCESLFTLADLISAAETTTSKRPNPD
jgi:orotate phosphoribosyltransferase